MATFLNFLCCPPTFYVLHPLLQVFTEAVGVVIPLGVASVSEVAEPGVVAVAVVAVEPGVASVSEVAEPVVVAVAVVVVEPEVVAAVVVAVEPQASVDIALAFDVLVPVSVVALEVDSPGCPRFLAFPNVDYSASSSSSVEVVG